MLPCGSVPLTYGVVKHSMDGLVIIRVSIWNILHKIRFVRKNWEGHSLALYVSALTVDFLFGLGFHVIYCNSMCLSLEANRPNFGWPNISQDLKSFLWDLPFCFCFCIFWGTQSIITWSIWPSGVTKQLSWYLKATSWSWPHFYQGAFHIKLYRWIVISAKAVKRHNSKSIN